MSLRSFLRNPTRHRKAVLTAQAFVLIGVLGWLAGAPEWCAAWIIYALVVGVSGNVVERAAGVVAESAHVQRDLDDLRKFYLTFCGQLILFVLGARAGWGTPEGPPEWTAQWLVMGLAAGTGGNVLEHVTAAWARVGRRKAESVDHSASAGPSIPPAS